MDARALEGIEEIADQTSIRVNERKKPRVKSLANPPTVSTCIARPVVGYKGLVETCRQRAIELAISRLELDRLAGLPVGYSAKLLGKDDGVPRKKKGCGPPASRRYSAPWACRSS
jgi:hypothetical protein